MKGDTMLISANTGIHSANPSGVRYDMVEAVDFFADAGFESLDVNFCGTIYRNNPKKQHEYILDGEESEWRARIDCLGERAAARGLPIKLSHLPFFAYADENDTEYQFRMEMLRRAANAAAILGARYTVLHVAPTTDETLSYARKICGIAAGYGIGIAVENSPRSTIPVLCESVDRLAAEGFDVGVCYDTGHANLTGLEQKDMLHAIGSRLVMLHVHDNNGEKDQHLPPFFGNINWREVMEALADIGYKGDFNYEVGTPTLPDDREIRLAHSRGMVAVADGFRNIYLSKLKSNQTV